MDLWLIVLIYAIIGVTSGLGLAIKFKNWNDDDIDPVDGWKFWTVRIIIFLLIAVLWIPVFMIWAWADESDDADI